MATWEYFGDVTAYLFGISEKSNALSTTLWVKMIGDKPMYMTGTNRAANGYIVIKLNNYHEYNAKFVSGGNEYFLNVPYW